MTESKAEVENLLAFFDKVVAMTYGEIQNVLDDGQEWEIFKHWLSLLRIDNATYELERARVRIIKQRKTPRTIEEAEAKLPIDDAIQHWKDLIASVGGPEEAHLELFNAAWIGHFVR